MMRRLHALASAALASVALLSLLATGCAAEKPPAAIRSWQEPTQTAAEVASTPVSAETTDLPRGRGKKTLEARVRVLSVGYGAEGGYLTVNFTAPPRLAMLWQPSALYIVDEATGVKYDRIPLMPKIGFLIGRPAVEGQLGYVMLENKPYVRPGSRVTVHLGGVIKKHVLTQTSQNTTPTAP
jgi:hypothetical protein